MSEAPMLCNDTYVIRRYERELETGLSRGTMQCRQLEQQISKKFGGYLATDSVPPHELEAVLLPWATEFYRDIALTLYKVLHIMQEEDCARGDVNLYFLPGYHSLFTSRRLFCGPADRLRRRGRATFGVGLHGHPRSRTPQSYETCCHSEWFHRATVRAGDGFYPASLYYWFMRQLPAVFDPAERIDRMVASLTFTTAADLVADPAFPDYVVTSLKSDDRTIAWGDRVADVLNGMKRAHDGWLFPGRMDRYGRDGFDVAREPEQRRIRLLLISLWMHSVFCTEPPDWLDDLIDETRRLGLKELEQRLHTGLSDTTAADWGDASTGRQPFTAWTTLILNPLTMPPPEVVIGPPKHYSRESGKVFEVARGIGWATMLCSVPLRLPFQLVARRWLRTMYAIVRNTEVSVSLRQRAALARAGYVSYVAFHELHRFASEDAARMARDASKRSSSAVEYRRFIVHRITSMTELINGLIREPLPTHVRRIRKDFAKGLNIPTRHLREALARAARDVLDNTGDGGGRVDIPRAPRLATILRRPGGTRTYITCLLLTGEIVRNHVQYGAAQDQPAKWSADVKDGDLVITLDAPAAQEPGGLTFRLLHNLLELACGGKAVVAWHQQIERATWTVQINLAKVMADDDSTPTATSENRR